MGKHVTLIHEVHDMWPSTLVELGGMRKNNPFIRIVQKAEDSAYRYSDKVVSIPPNAESYMKEHGLADGKFINIPNGVVTEDWMNAVELPESVLNIFLELKQQGKFIVGYFGGHALSNALDVMLDCAKLMSEDERCSNIVFVSVGKGAEKPRLMERARKEDIKNIVFLDAVDKRSIPTLLGFFDCIYMGTTKSTLYRFGLGLNKLYDAMMAEKPIILSTDAESTLVEKYTCGIVVPAENPKAIQTAILRMRDAGKEQRDKYGRNGKDAVLKFFTYDKLSSDFERCMGKDGKKNIILINHYAGSPTMGMEFRPYYFAREWVKKGHRVDIFAADFSHLRTINPQVKKDFQEEVIDGIHYHWVKSFSYEGNGVRRALTMFSFVMKLRRKARKIVEELSPDVIITSSTYPMDTYVGQKMKAQASIM